MEYFIIDLAINSDFTTFVNGYQGRIELSNSISISGLLPSTNYFTRILRVKDGRQTPYAYFNFTTNALNAPTAQDPTSVTFNSFRANWTVVSGVDGYSVDLLNSSNVVISTVTTTNNYYDFTGLSELTTYKYRVRSVKGSNQSVNSGTKTLSTLSNIPNTPDILSTTSITSTGFTANWNLISGATSYDISINDGVAINVLTNTYNATGLSSGSTNIWKVRAKNESGSSDYSGILFVLLIPATPTSLAVSSYTNTTATITWNESTGASSYKLYIKLSGTPISGYNGKVITGTSENVTGLSENTTYTIEIIASNASGDSALSGSVSFTTYSSSDFYIARGWDLWYGKNSMIGSGTNLANQSTTTINATITNPSWETSVKWGNGLNMNSSGRQFAIPNNAIYKSSGSNAQVAIANVITIKSLETSTFRVIYYTQNPPNTEFNLYVAFDSSQKLFLVAEMLDNTQSTSPAILDLKMTPKITVTAGQDLGIGFRIDLLNSVIEFIVNQTVYSYTIESGSLYYNSIADFKTNGGINSANQIVYSTRSPITIQRYAIKKGVSGSLISANDIKQDFNYMGLI